MQFSAASVLALLAGATSAIEIAQLSALLSDLQQNSAQYVSYIQANPQKYPASMYALVQKATDTGFFPSLAAEWPSAEFTSFTNGFPGADRISSELYAATAGGAAAAATTSAAASGSASTSAAAAASTSAAASTVATSVVSNSSVSSNGSSSDAASTSASSTSASGAAAQLYAFPALAALSFLALI